MRVVFWWKVRERMLEINRKQGTEKGKARNEICKEKGDITKKGSENI